MPAFLYRCPTTKRFVQGWTADEITDDQEHYRPTECLACGRMHLVNPKTSKVVGGDDT